MAQRPTSVVFAFPGLMLALLLAALDQTSMAPALPEIAGDLGGLERMPTVVTAYLVAATAVMPLYGKLGDRYGRKPLIQAAVVLFVLGAVIAAFSTTLAAFVTARIIQGIGGGGLMIGAQAIVGEIVSPRERGRYLGLFGAVYVLAAVGGPLVGGVLVDQLSWRWIFALHPPLGLAALAALSLTLHLPRPRPGPPVDYAGAAALAASVVGTVLLADALGRPGSHPGWTMPALGACTLVALAVWAFTARLAHDPVLPPRLLRDRAFALPVAVSFLIGFGLFGTLTYVPAFAQIALGTTATRAGLMVTAMMAGALVSTVVSGRLITRTGRYRRYPVAGTALATVGTVSLGLLGSRLDAGLLVALLVLIGLGIGMVMQVVVLAAQNAVGRTDLGAATSAVLFMRQIGASAGVAAVGALITAGFSTRAPEGVADPRALTPEAIAALPTPTRELVEAAYGAALPSALLAMAPMLGLAFLLTLALPALPLRTTAHSDPDETSPDSPTDDARSVPADRGPAPTVGPTPQGERMTHDRLVAPLDAFGAQDLAEVGGKAANLGELLREGIPVPPGFVVTTGAYAAVARAAGIDARVRAHAGTTDPAALRADLENTPVPEDLRTAVVDAYTALGPDVPVAVRSSATAEDLPGAAFAGQQDTYLDVVGADAVVSAVRRCWASLWTDRAVAYRRERSIDPAEVRIAVVVQAMVDSEVAGVAFTADPVTGARDRVLVDAGSGLGEAVVSGLVTPDHYVLDEQGNLLDWTPGRGEVVLRPGSGDGVLHEETADELPAGTGGSGAGGTGVAVDTGAVSRNGAARLLSDTQLSVLAAHARTIADHFGRPQDIEWSVDERGVHIVQARPMTALPPPSVPLDRFQRLQASILTEYVPIRPYPMDVSTWLGHGPARLMRGIAEYYGLSGAFQDFLVEEDGVVVELRPPNPRPTPRMLFTPLRLAGKAHRFDVRLWQRDPRFTGFLRRADELDTLDPAALSWTELLRVPERALELLDPNMELRRDYLPGSGLAVLRLTAALTLLRRRSVLGDLLGGARTRTEDANLALQDLADLVRSDPELRALFTSAEPAQVLAAVRDGADRGFGDRLAAFLREFGRRETATPLMVSPPTLAESPETVIGLVQVLVDRPRTEDPGSRSDRALASLMDHPLLRSRRARDRVTRWVRAAQRGTAFREDSHFYFTAPLPALRRSLLEMGARLRDVGVVEEAFDVFHLRMEEVREVADPADVPVAQVERLRSLVRSRAAKRAELAGVRLIDPARVFPAEEAGDALVTGAPAGSGTATGTVRVIHGAADFHRLRSGDVLVCPYTNPSWTPLFQRAAAVVVDTGSVGSHAAIVAREYGIPAVMGSGSGTSILTDGERVTVDGGSGRVMGAP
ncbi:MFS transporter [Nocardiopsis salina]|uniref:MFS transporter n=1 Tax=Nocardiopsis salina TaxID=245836 RepID=UPI000344BEDF|nr:MFS transporter [Nocardiopsis salina]